jgi:tRNA (guanine-N7-)-methyltransferase
MRLKNKPWAKPLIAANPDRLSEDAFPFIPKHQGEAHLEIGMGKGDFIVGKAKQHPNVYFYGVERATTVFAFALKKVIEHQCDNVHLLLGDFAKFSLSMQPEIFSVIYLNFSDPWPKLRHHKRRLTAEGNLEKITRLLKKGGQLVMKTDNLELFEFTLKKLALFPYDILSIEQPYSSLAKGDIETEYERYFRERNEPIYRVIGVKR